MKEKTPIFDIPRLDDITIDGKADDWGDRGFRVAVLGDERGRVKPAADLDASFRLGWDERGLLVLVRVTGGPADEAKDDTEIWERDSVELFYAPFRGSPDVIQMVVSPGVDPQRPKLRSTLQDERRTESLKKSKVMGDVARTRIANGYQLEALLPWANFGIEPKVGREMAFQLYVNDMVGGSRAQVLWYPIANGHDSMRMHRIRLSEKPGPAIEALASAEYALFRRVSVRVAGAPDLLGKTITLKEGGTERGRTRMTSQDGRAGAEIVLPMPPHGKAYGPLEIHLKGRLLSTINLPDPEAARARVFMTQRLSFQPGLFSGVSFPKCEFENPGYAEDVIGNSALTVTYYDGKYNKVTMAEKPGRYGAVVEIKTDDGRKWRRLRTLFKMPREVAWLETELPVSIELPKEAGIDPIVAKEQKRSIENYLRSLVRSNIAKDANAAALLAALYETKRGSKDPGVSGDYVARDRQWWVGLKRILTGADKRYPKPFVCPGVAKGKPSPVIREGSLKEAGMKSGAVREIDALLTEWSGGTKEPFSVCVARHGVIVSHKAYGKRDGKPMTLTMKSWMASITKAMSGTAMMMLVDQGLVKLDDPVSKFLPAFQGRAPTKTLTIRHLFTHTNGLQDHWGDDINDFDDMIAGYHPYMEVGERHEYNGAGLALGCKIIELITGEALPQFYKHHLLDPLGCPNTDVTTSSFDAESTPLDTAKFGQMLLNRGSYGNKRFMSPETFQQMLPIPLTGLLGPETTIEWGIGVTWFKDEGLGKGTFGHGAASSATMRIDPEHDLVIVMCRNGPGSNFGTYHKKFLDLVIESVDG